MITPLPRASPSALMTIGYCKRSQNRRASSLRSNVPACAVGIPCSRINSFAKIFEDSTRAAALVGPKMRDPSAANRSTIPAASGSSGPTTVRSTRFSLAKRSSAARSVAEIAMFSPSSAVPAFPGAQKMRSTYGDCFNFHASACSRPPLPTTRIFTAKRAASLREACFSASRKPSPDQLAKKHASRNDAARFAVKILVVGSGGREHALAWKLKQSPYVERIFCAPGNAGTAELGENIAISATDLAALLRFAKENRVDLTVVGPDDPLAAGIVDLFAAEGSRIFGPTK